jgi:ppGpp synthetase/RelA/SpoT-type nucleotidyltranferase
MGDASREIDASPEEVREWLRDQAAKYTALYPRYKLYANTLDGLLRRASERHAPLAIVQARPKSISGFAEKALRKREEYIRRYGCADPVNQITDLCGARVVTQTREEVDVICEFVKEHFDIDSRNTVDCSERLKPTEFGYRSVHYVVKFKPDVFPTKGVEATIPDDVYGLWAEIQVRTLLEHAWADFTHNVTYKSAFEIPTKWERELSGLAATLEATDGAFSRIQAGLQTYAASYGAYMTPQEIADEIATQEIVLEHDPENVRLAHRIGKLAITLGDWPKAVALLSNHVDSEYQPLTRDLGVAMCKLHHDDPASEEYQQGQRYLEEAIRLDPKDSDAPASLAGTLRGRDDDRAQELYRQAHEVDPSDPYPLGNFLGYQIARTGDTSLVALMGPVIGSVIQRCRNQADVGMNLPWAFYDMGKFLLLLGQPYESLAAHAKAVQLSTEIGMIDTSLRALDELRVAQYALLAFEWVRRLLLVSRAARFPSEEAAKQVKELALTDHEPIQGPVVIVAGGCDVSVEEEMQSYRPLVLEGLSDFKGTIISSGTTAGIGGLIGDVQQEHPDTIRTIGYMPRLIPADVSKDRRYSEVRHTEGNDFSALEPLQYWIDIIASGIHPSDVKLLGINGNTIAAAEYRIALALGARVLLVEDSGREAARLLSDGDWSGSEMLVRLPADGSTMSAIIGSRESPLKPEARDTIARAIHEAYRTTQLSGGQGQEPSLAEWEDLLDYLKESNRQAADHIAEKLRRIGCTIHKVEGHEVSLLELTQDEIEAMAEMEHARWNAERLLDGWKLGEEKDVANKISPYLVRWQALPDDVKEWDRDTVRKIPEFLAKVGLEVRRNKQDEQ